MAKLIYLTPTSLDGSIADETSNLDWSAPDEEGFAFISDLLRLIGVYLYGSKMYETWWSRPRRPCDPGRARRRVSTARCAYYAWRRQAGPAQQRMRKAGSPRRAPFC